MSAPPTAVPRRRPPSRLAGPAPGLLAFAALAFALSWGWAFSLVAAGTVVRQGRAWPTHYPALLGPAIAAVVVTAWTAGRPGLRDLGARLLRWHVPLRWWLMALSPLGLLAVALPAMALTGEVLPAAAGFGLFSGTPAIGAAGVAALVVVVNALGEETGWRGYALPQLQRLLAPLPATLVLAVVWFAWHLPYFWLLDTYRHFAPPMYAVMFLGLACGAVVLTWVYNRSGGSLLLAVVWHGVYNLATGTAAADGTPQVVVTAGVMVLGVSLVVQELRARRQGRPSVLGPRPVPTDERPGAGQGDRREVVGGGDVR